MNVVLVDDERLGLDYLTSLCEKIPMFNDIKAFTRARDAFHWCKENPVDIALIDISMPDINGITLVTKLRKVHPNIKIIFVTAYERYAVDAFGAHADGYLLKPINLTMLSREIDYVVSGLQKGSDEFQPVGLYGRYLFGGL